MTQKANMTVDGFRNAMDGDTGFKSKRRALTFVSLLLIALIASGAEIKEANTFIFKIEFTNHAGLKYLLALAVTCCMFRYFAYSEKYHAQLYNFWSTRLLNDFKVFYYDQESESVGGLLGRKIDIYGGDEPGLQSPTYIKTGLLKRSIAYSSTGTHDYYGEHTYTEYIDLNGYTESWSKAEFRKLLLTEMKYRLEAWIKYRETLDLISPYLLGFSSLGIFLYKHFYP
ncbi:hypothetical protein [Pseudomonas sp. R9.37]|uniref:hypothetical protein n=1 Tax=Pseudomonas sp. R9.37 TaxID=1390498 RepID=UPI0011B1CC36|nr:hypothetical protein [Pseudomonas sp. R9.37]